MTAFMTKCVLCPKLEFLFQFCLMSQEAYFTQQAIAYSLLNSTGTSGWQDKSYLTHFLLSWRWRHEKEKAIHWPFTQIKTKYVNLSPSNPSCLWFLFKIHDPSYFTSSLAKASTEKDIPFIEKFSIQYYQSLKNKLP